MANVFSVNGSNLAMGTKFDTNNQYIRKVVNPANRLMYLATGPTIAIATTTISGGLYWAWRWQVGTATQVGVDGGTTAPATGFNTSLDVAL